MKTANDLREVVRQREDKLAEERATAVKKFVEETLAPRMEGAARDGSSRLHIPTEDFCAVPGQVTEVLDYLHSFGFTAHVTGFGVEVKW